MAWPIVDTLNGTPTISRALCVRHTGTMVCIAHRQDVTSVKSRRFPHNLIAQCPARQYVDVHTSEMAPFIDDVRNVIGTSPTTDNHAGDLLRPHGSQSSNFLTMTPEVSGGTFKSVTDVSRLS